MKKDYINSVVLFILLYVSSSSSLTNPYFIFALGILLFFKHLGDSGKFKTAIFILAAYWIFASFFTSIFFNHAFSFFPIIRSIFYFVLTPYFLLSRYGTKFWVVFEKWVYRLTVISIPLYILNILMLPVFNNLKGVFNPLTRDVLRESSSTYWSSVIYTNAIPMGNGILRNCGFMWEPGYFALMIVFGIIFHWSRNGVKYDRKTYIYIIALITTFSTAGYFALVILLGSSFIKRLSIINILFLSIFGYIFFSFIYKMDFMSGKMSYYIDTMAGGKMNYNNEYDAIKLNRFQILFYNFKRIATNPIGYGVYSRIGLEGTNVTGVNGLSGILLNWGVFVFAYFTKKWWQYLKLMNKINLPVRTLLLYFIALLIMFFSNPIESNILPFLFIATAIVLVKDNPQKIK